MPIYIVLLGPPGSGKGTQAKLVAEEYGLPHVSTGDLFRAMRTQDTPLARKVRKILDEGGLVPDDVTIDMVKERLSRPDCRNGALLDGFPRTVGQAEALDRLLAEVFGSKVALVPLFEVAPEETIRRIELRGEIEGRADDKREVAEKRFEVYQQNTAPLIDFYRRKGLLVTIDAAKDVAGVTAQILPIIGEQLRKA